MRTLAIIIVLCLLAIGCQQRASVAAKKTVTKEALEDLRSYIERNVEAGFRPEKTIAKNAVEILSDECDADALLPHATAMTRELLATHKREQESWPKTTDCDRLDAAFAELERAGIVSRQDFSDCGTCGVGEIHDEMQNVSKSGKRVRGYAFYHSQDTESAVEGSGLFLNYGAVQDSEAAAVAVGKEISAALTRQGLNVDWDGTWAKRIKVKMDWKKRR